MHKPIASIVLQTPLRTAFDYQIPTHLGDTPLKPGMRVQVPFGRRTATGIVLACKTHSDIALNKLKPIEKILDTSPVLSEEIVSLAHWASRYYHHPIGDVILSCLPQKLRKGHDVPSPALPSVTTERASPPNLTEEQKTALHHIRTHEKATCHLLEGVTGSGKTEVYLALIEDMLQQNKQALVLVPEISLTPQLIERFQTRLDVPLVALHSGLTPKKRCDAWVLASKGEARVVIGTRSAIWTPMPELGLILVDEEHDLSFKQQTGLLYSARDLSIKRAQACNIPIVLGSATPSLESFQNAMTGTYQHLTLLKRATQATLPRWQCIDTRGEPLISGLTQAVIRAMKKHLQQGNQVLLFLNRRGFSPVLMCPECGWQALCSRCDAKLTYHRAIEKLVCHHCTQQKPAPKHCPDCQADEIAAVGIGTEQLEATCLTLFKEAEIIRVDRDTTRKKGSLHALLDKIKTGKKQVLIGTQMLSKGHDFPNLTLSILLNMDASLFSSDFRGTEHLGQLMTQVAGRAGRHGLPGEVLVQTAHPHDSFLQCLIQKPYATFLHALLKERKAAALPPDGCMALLRAEAKSPQAVFAFLTHMKTHPLPKTIVSLGPTPSAMARRAGFHRAQIIFMARARGVLREYLSQLVDWIEQGTLKKSVRWCIDVDPMDVL